MRKRKGRQPKPAPTEGVVKVLRVRITEADKDVKNASGSITLQIHDHRRELFWKAMQPPDEENWAITFIGAQFVDELEALVNRAIKDALRAKKRGPLSDILRRITG